MRTIWLAAAALGAVSLSACASNTPTAMAAADAALPAAATTSAPAFAAEAARSDLYEIQSGKLAQTRGGSAEVRQMGQMLVRDHTMTSQKLMAALSAAGMPMSPPPLDAKRQAMLDQLQRASGAEFDRLFHQQQAMAHQEALALHKGYAANGDVPALRAVAAEASGLVAQHLNQVQGHANH